MTGYQEIVTDPSFAEQIVTFTAPMVGNYGVERTRSESAGPPARGGVMREARGPGRAGWLFEQRVRPPSRGGQRRPRPPPSKLGAQRSAPVSRDATCPP